MAKAKGILACDVGNSRIAMACVACDEASDVRRLAGDDAAALADALAEVWEATPEPKRIAASSVSPAGLERLEAAAERLGQKVLVVGRELDLPIETALDDPAAVGTDRLCAAAMAYHRTDQACVVADFGTAITIDCVNAEGVFLGGAILPGLTTGAEALARQGAQLPKVQLVAPDWVFGRDTRQAIVGGLVFGARGALRTIAEAYATELGVWPVLILTGGDAELIGAGCDDVHAIVPDLALTGVALAHRLHGGAPSPGDEQAGP